MWFALSNAIHISMQWVVAEDMLSILYLVTLYVASTAMAFVSIAFYFIPQLLSNSICSSLCANGIHLDIMQLQTK